MTILSALVPVCAATSNFKSPIVSFSLEKSKAQENMLNIYGV